jgi:hypothetical protein
MKIILCNLIFLILLSCVPKNQKNTEIIDNNIIEILVSNNENTEEIKLSTIFDYSIIEHYNNRYFSPDNKSYAIPITMNMQNNSGVYINLDGIDIFIPIQQLAASTGILWSNDQNYLFVDSGTYVYRSFICINISTKEIIGYIEKMDPYYQVLDHNTIITTTRDGYRIDNLVEKHSVFLYTVEGDSISKKIVFESDEFTDYFVIDFDGEYVMINKTTFVNTNSENPWIRYHILEEEIILFK